MKCKGCGKSINGNDLRIEQTNGENRIIGHFHNMGCVKKWRGETKVVVNHNHFVEDDVAVKKKAKVVILDNNPLSVSCYMDEHPETFKKKKVELLEK